MIFDDEDIFDDDLKLLDILENGYPRRVHQRKNYYEDMDDYTFFRKFRLYKETVLNVLGQIEDRLEYKDNRNQSVSPINQLLVTLRYYATDGYLNSLGDFGGMDPVTVSRIIVRVSEVIASLAPLYINMPEDLVSEHMKFNHIARFPKISGLIDGTHIRISSPGGDDAEIFRNRKGYFSFNTQIVCDAEMKITDIVARWPGSTHDATIFMNGRLCAKMENGDFPHSFLIGDSGYPLQKILLTPLANPITRAENLYNEALIRTRNMVERTIGIWKNRFPVLAYGLRLKKETAMTVIVATAVSHNIARTMNEAEPPLPEELNRERLNFLIEMGNMDDLPAPQNNMPAELIQTNIDNTYFGNL